MGHILRILPRYAMLAQYICCRRVSVCPFVRPSHAGLVSKRINTESRKHRRTIAQGL